MLIVYVLFIAALHLIVFGSALYHSIARYSTIDRQLKLSSAAVAFCGTIMVLTLYLRTSGERLFSDPRVTYILGSITGLALIALVAFCGFFSITLSAELEGQIGNRKFWFSGRSRNSIMRQLIWQGLGILICNAYAIGVFYAADEMKSRVIAIEPFPWRILEFIAAGFVEELYFRGYIQRTIEHRIELRCGPRSGAVAVTITAAFFAVSHFQGLISFLSVFPTGIFLGIVARRSGLAYAMGAHFVFNLVNFVLFGSSIS